MLAGDLPIDYNNTNLLWLYLDGNLYTSINKNLGNLSNLRNLFLNENPNLKELPIELENLFKLEKLNVYNTGLTFIPKPICDLEKNGLIIVKGDNVNCQ